MECVVNTSITVVSGPSLLTTGDTCSVTETWRSSHGIELTMWTARDVAVSTVVVGWTNYNTHTHTHTHTQWFMVCSPTIQLAHSDDRRKLSTGFHAAVCVSNTCVLLTYSWKPVTHTQSQTSRQCVTDSTCRRDDVSFIELTKWIASE